MNCEVCQKSVEPESRFCRHCGAKIAEQPQSASDKPIASEQSKNDFSRLWTVLGLLVLGVIVVIVSGLQSDINRRNSSEVEAASVADAVAAATQAAIAAETAAKDAEGANGNSGDASTSSRWTYSQDEDKVRGGITYYAETVSTNSIAQSFPYSDTTTMKVIVRKSPAYGTDVLLTISSGQMMCPSYDGCSGTVRFDDGPAQRISFNGPADNSSDTVFVVGAKSFISKMKRAKRVVIEKTLYQAGNPQFTFEVEGLKWEH